MAWRVNIRLKRFSYRYFPYEERLLAEEAAAIGDIVADKNGWVEVRSRTRPNAAEFTIQRLHRLTYFSHFSLGDGLQFPTQQFLFETTANGSRTAARQSTRYSTHGLHEYKGKFHPQIARHLMSRTNLTADSVVLDPFAGSGTVLVEAIHFGCMAFGIEANPLAVLIANSKIKLLTCPDRDLRTFLDVVRAAGADLNSPKPADRYTDRLGLSQSQFAYLRSWFAPPILAALLKFRSHCRARLSVEFAGVADVLVSSLAREVSQQDPADLRIRRRKKPLENAPVAELLSTVTTTVLKRALSARNLLGSIPRAGEVLLGDSRCVSDELQQKLHQIGRQRVDAIITSPPYATALPYIDTSRLSMVLLGLCEPPELKSLERLQIGNREISPAERRKAEESFELTLAALPTPIEIFIKKLLSKLKNSDAGFRKRNTPALLAQYFTDMKAVLTENYKLIEAGGVGFWLVGPNRTQVNNEWLDINTPQWLACIAESVGFLASLCRLDAYQRFGIHQRNGIRQEFLLTLSRN